MASFIPWSDPNSPNPVNMNMYRVNIVVALLMISLIPLGVCLVSKKRYRTIGDDIGRVICNAAADSSSVALCIHSLCYALSNKSIRKNIVHTQQLIIGFALGKYRLALGNSIHSEIKIAFGVLTWLNYEF